MCGLFGLMDCNNVLSEKEKNKLLHIFAKESEARGTDASGIAYNTIDESEKKVMGNEEREQKSREDEKIQSQQSNYHITVYKRPRAGGKLHINLPKATKTIIGHTRMTTQGDAKYNCNNHPFKGKTKNNQHFALAHNGVLYNDDTLRIIEELPESKIETDSYVAVQLLEQQEIINFESIRTVAEQLEGTFVLTILDDANNLYIVKGDNPLCLRYYPRWNLYLYTSTEEIMVKALKQINFALGEWEKIEVKEGEILKIDAQGNRSKETFELIPWYGTYTLGRCYSYGYGNSYSGYGGYGYYRYQGNSATKPTENRNKEGLTKEPSQKSKKDGQQEYIEDLKAVAGYYGYLPEEIDELLKQGYSGEEIEELLYMELSTFSYA